MVLRSASDFAREILDAASHYDKIKSTELQIQDSVVVRARFQLEHRFIDVFYNSQTGTTAFALIKNNERVFGADNTGGWHIHPKNNPQDHISSNRVSFADFLKRALD